MDEIIRKLIRKYKTNDPFDLAKQLNISVWYANLGTSTRGFYSRQLRRRYIVINDELDFEWSRFVCAHELAHDRLHPGVSQFWLDEHSFYNVGKFERQANKFAIRLLTVNDRIHIGESVSEYLQRNGIPPELSKFYF